jgi:hypothetical protein
MRPKAFASLKAGPKSREDEFLKISIPGHLSGKHGLHKEFQLLSLPSLTRFPLEKEHIRAGR